MKRFQDCKGIEKLWRYRWYLLIPFRYMYYNYFSNLNCIEHDDENNYSGTYSLKNKVLWKVLIGEAQGQMKWYYTMEEVKERIDKKWKNN